MFPSPSGKLVLPMCQRNDFSLFNRKIQQILSSSDKEFLVSNYRNFPGKCFLSLEKVFHSKMKEILPFSGIDDLSRSRKIHSLICCSLMLNIFHSITIAYNRYIRR